MIEFGIPEGLCQCGCGRKTKVSNRTLVSHGWVVGKPRPFVPGHRYEFRQDVKETRFWCLMRIRPNGCWDWIGTIDDKGYGKYSDVRNRFNRTMKAHRLAYELIFGSVPPKLELDHSCRNRSCVNPWHLEPVTHLVNMRRGANTKLSDEQIAAIRNSDETCVVLAQRFGVAGCMISAVRSRENYHRDIL